MTQNLASKICFSKRFTYVLLFLFLIGISFVSFSSLSSSVNKTTSSRAADIASSEISAITKPTGCEKVRECEYNEDRYGGMRAEYYSAASFFSSDCTLFCDQLMYKSIKTYDGSTFNSCFDTKENAFVCYRDTNSNADPQRPKPLIKDVESGWLKTPGKTVKELPFCSWYKGSPDPFQFIKPEGDAGGGVFWDYPYYVSRWGSIVCNSNAIFSCIDHEYDLTKPVAIDRYVRRCYSKDAIVISRNSIQNRLSEGNMLGMPAEHCNNVSLKLGIDITKNNCRVLNPPSNSPVTETFSYDKAQNTCEPGSFLQERSTKIACRTKTDDEAMSKRSENFNLLQPWKDSLCCDLPVQIRK